MSLLTRKWQELMKIEQLNYPSDSRDRKNPREVELEIAQLTGERYTIANRIVWIDNKLEALRAQLKLIHSQME